MTSQPDTAAIRAQCDNHGWYSAVILDLCDALDAAEARIAAIEALAVRYAEASRDAPLYPHVDSGRAWHWVAIDIRAALAGGTDA